MRKGCWKRASGRSSGSFEPSQSRLRRASSPRGRAKFFEYVFKKLHVGVQLFCVLRVWVKGGSPMKRKKDFRQRVRCGEISGKEVRRLRAGLRKGQ